MVRPILLAVAIGMAATGCATPKRDDAGHDHAASARPAEQSTKRCHMHASGAAAGGEPHACTTMQGAGNR